MTEAVNKAEEEFGIERLSRIVVDGSRLPVQDLCEAALSQVADFARGMPQYDDQTVLIVRRT